jgi:hypothetical protein
MSENGPREGTRDLPRRDPEAGFRAADESSAAGTAYRKLAQSLRRRRAELFALAAAGGTPSSIAAEYQSKHPLEAPVSTREIEAAVQAARDGSTSRRT